MIISTVISSFIMVINVIIIWNNYSEEKIKILSIKNIVSLVLVALFSLFNYFYINQIIKIINITLALIIFNRILYKKDLKYSIYNALFIQILYIIGEVIYSIIVLSFITDLETFVNSLFGSFISNVSISILALLLSFIKYIKKAYNHINEKIMKINDNTIVYFSVLLLCIYNLLSLTAFKQIDSNLLLLQSLLISLTLVAVFIYVIKIKDDNIELLIQKSDNEVSIKALEALIIEKNINDHETKNHFRTIKTLTKNKKVNAFIDSILEESYSEDIELKNKLNKIPCNRITGIIYTKIQLMNKFNIEYELDISNTITFVDFNNYTSQNILNIIKIIGVLLDNAIEEVKNKDNKYIMIEIYVDEDINIIITNPIDSNISKDKVFEIGYSTKGNNHGYGLSLVNKILKKDKLLKLNTEISETEFSQILKIKNRV